MNVVLCKWDKEIFNELKKQKSKIILILDDFDAAFNTIPYHECLRVFQIPDYNSLEQIIEIATTIKLEALSPNIILSHTELSQTGAAIMAETLEIKNFSLDLALYSRDKRLMKERAKDSGWECADYSTVPQLNNQANIEIFAQELSYPAVIKPSNGYGTFTTFIVNNPTELIEKTSKESLQLHPLLRSAQLTAESFIKGDEYNSNAIWKDGKIIHLSIAKNFVPRIQAHLDDNLNGSYIIEETTDNNKRLYQQIKDGLQKYMKDFSFFTGITHLEFFINEGKIYFSEIATRVGGGGVDMLYRCRYGQSLRKQYVLIFFTPEEVEVKDNQKNLTYGYINITPKSSGEIKSIASKDSILALEYIKDAVIFKKIGDQIDITNNPSTWCILICFAIPSNKDLFEETKKLKNKIDISVN